MVGTDLPYFDRVLAAIEADPASELARAFGRHFHWGCYADSSSTDTSVDGYLTAADALTQRLVAAAEVADGSAVLDVGCGFGGTIEHLDGRFESCVVTGLNIDERQLRRARELVGPGQGNRLAWVTADACRLPVADASADVVLAVECVFHFPSRKQFFREAARVLRPGGVLALSDFVVRDGRMEALGPWLRDNEHRASDFYGSSRNPVSSTGYGRLAKGNRLDVVVDDDVTANTLPTYPAMRGVYERAGVTEGVRATDYLEAMAVDELVAYRVLAFRKR